MLTRKLLDDAFRAIRNQPPDPCRRHIVSPQALRRGTGYAFCASCGARVKLGSQLFTGS